MGTATIFAAIPGSARRMARTECFTAWCRRLHRKATCVAFSENDVVIAAQRTTAFLFTALRGAFADTYAERPERSSARSRFCVRQLYFTAVHASVGVFASNANSDFVAINCEKPHSLQTRTFGYSKTLGVCRLSRPGK